MTTSRLHRPNERGAVLVHVAVVLVGLIAFTAFAYDYGVMFVSRREAQNAADAGALAGAISLSYVDPNDLPLAQTSAVDAARSNAIWGQTPDILTTDVTFPPCPPGAPGVAGTCVRADVFRTNYNRGGGSPLPTFFAQLVGVNEQGVRATATAQKVVGSGTADCIKPVAIPDKWLEFNPTAAPWDPTSTFDRYNPRTGALLSPADVYNPPVPGNPGDPGSGFTLPTDYGVQLVLKEGSPSTAIDPGWYNPIVLNPGCVGGNCYRDAWATCTGAAVNPGDTITVEPGNMVGPTKQGVNALIDLDPNAQWGVDAAHPKGAPLGGCMADGTCTRSPRWIAIPLYDPDRYAYERATISNGGRNVTVHITKILGFWLDRMVGNEVHGHILYYPTLSLTGTPIPGPSSFASTIILVR